MPVFVFVLAIAFVFTCVRVPIGFDERLDVCYLCVANLKRQNSKSVSSYHNSLFLSLVIGHEDEPEPSYEPLVGRSGAQLVCALCVCV